VSEQQGDKTSAEPSESTQPTASTASPAPAAANAGAALSDLMASAASEQARKGPDLERDALRAAEQALAEGQRALAAARAHFGTESPSPPQRSGRTRELLLRGALIFNLMAMIVLALLPAPAATTDVAADPHATTGHPAPTPDPGSIDPTFHEPWNKALAAAERRDFAAAITILEQYLSPRMAPSQQLNVLMALAHYSARLGKFQEAQEYQRRADAIDKSHSLPEDLVAMAKAAAQSGDQESLRRIWARFLLQQRQVPSWLYKHVAEAYLQLGDSYRLEANAAAEKARLEELERTAAELRARTVDGGERGK
jgi:tetratricopeptide (TPR) repeat protein